MRALTHIAMLRIALGLILALGTGLARTEKVWAQNLNGLHHAPLALQRSSGEGQEPFDPRRVPSSGGAASRLLAGIVVKHA